MKVLIRCNAGKISGLGHLTRCIALAESLKTKNIDSFFLIKSDNPTFIADFLNKEEISNNQYLFLENDIKQREDVKFVIKYYNHGFSFLILDHYDHDLDYQEELKKAGMRWAQFDYSAIDEIRSDLIINANISAQKKDYIGITSPDAILCVGYEYAIVRKNIVLQTAQPVKNKVLVAMGGGTLSEENRNLILSLLKNSSFTFEIVSNDTELRSLVQKHPNCKLHSNPKDVSLIYKKCEIAVVAGGVTTFELAVLDIPQFIVPFTTNQLPNAKAWEKNNFAMSFQSSSAFIQEIKRVGLKFLVENLKEKYLKKDISIDGLGADRIVSLIVNLV